MALSRALALPSPTALEFSVFSLQTGKESGGFYGPGLELTGITCADSPLARIQSYATLTVREPGNVVWLCVPERRGNGFAW